MFCKNWVKPGSYHQENVDHMVTKGERREQKKKRAWYKRHLANNRKALEVLIQAQKNKENA